MFGTPGGGIHPLIGGVIFRILHLLPVAQHSRVIQELRRVTTPALWRSAMEPHLPYGLTTQEHTHPLEKETVRFYSALVCHQ